MDSKEVGSLDKAKEAIDLANANPETANETKTQVYRAQIYYTIFEANLRLATDALLASINDPNKRTLLAYQNTNITELDTSYAAFSKAKLLDIKENYKSDIEKGLAGVVIHYENKALADNNAKKYKEALFSFEKTYLINGQKDTNILSYCALLANRSEMNDKAKYYYSKMIEQKVGGSSTYNSYYSLLVKSNDSIAATEVLKKGRAAYPNDINLLIKETNYYISHQKSNEALENLNKAISAKPDDYLLYFARANITDNIANPKDASGKDLDKPKDYKTKLKAAEDDYKKALDLKPDFFDGLFNLGVLYNNHGREINMQADKLSSDKASEKQKYDSENARAIAEFNKAMAVFEKALQVNPKDKGTMTALKQIYARLGLTDKLNAIIEKLKN
jgi:predicted Zn-dependent protease